MCNVQGMFYYVWIISYLILPGSFDLIFMIELLPLQQVRIMRKHAISVMSRVYNHDSGGYPIEKFTRLLCFNSNVDALSTLRHYSIPYNEEIMVIQFYSSLFEDPGEKVQVDKMDLIESKVNGTRLYICRGGCSVECFALQPPPFTTTGLSKTKSTANQPKPFLESENSMEEQLIRQQQAVLNERISRQAAEEEVNRGKSRAKAEYIQKVNLKNWKSLQHFVDRYHLHQYLI